MKDSLVVGLSKTERIDVDAGRTISFFGDDLAVYSTPSLIYDIEVVARNLMLEHSDEGEDSVGTVVNIAHMGATLKGNWVEITATITELKGPGVTFEIVAKDALETVCKGSHQRFAVPIAGLEAKLKGKAAKIAAL
ncbi:MAG: LysR family transcriptional regulator [Rhodospirillales bacterium]|nr:LysR family transcriptional regulator [Rhodospirillales bacterium]